MSATQPTSLIEAAPVVEEHNARASTPETPFDGVIVDVGVHNGDDSAFYLAKGFRVVGVEANPRLCERIRSRFADQITDRRYVLIEGAIAPEPGEVEFIVNLDKDDWSSIDPRYGARDGTRVDRIRVRGIAFSQVLREYPDIHYLKCDIEGGDVHVLRSLLASSARPRHVSVEAHDARYLGFLAACGYERFKLVNQNLNWSIALPKPAREGVYIAHQFPPESSGPFGEEAPGDWMDFNETAEMYLALLRAVKRQPTISNAWYDFHATW